LYRTDPDFVFTVTLDFFATANGRCSSCRMNVPAHPYAVAMETAMLGPHAK